MGEGGEFSGTREGFLEKKTLEKILIEARANVREEMREGEKRFYPFNEEGEGVFFLTLPDVLDTRGVLGVRVKRVNGGRRRELEMVWLASFPPRDGDEVVYQKWEGEVSWGERVGVGREGSSEEVMRKRKRYGVSERMMEIKKSGIKTDTLRSHPLSRLQLVLTVGERGIEVENVGRYKVGIIDGFDLSEEQEKVLFRGGSRDKEKGEKTMGIKEAVAVTNKGVARRRNEDFGMVVTGDEGQRGEVIRLSLSPEEIKEKGGLLVVADGVGGELHGQEASRAAVAAFGKSFYEEGLPPNQAMSRAHQAAQETGGMTTLTAAIIKEEGKLKIVHVGDSRAYVFSRGELTQLTTDHNLAHSGQKNILTRALGGYNAQSEEIEGTLKEGDIVFLCTDGLNIHVSDKEIKEALNQVKEGRKKLEDVVSGLIRLANERGGGDNITIAAAIVD